MSLQDNMIETYVFEEFPFDTFNSGQKETIIKAIKALLDGKKHVIISAPTGSGKSAIAITIHKVMKRIRKEYRSCIITSTIGLQKQYKDDYPDLLDLKSKVHYPCNKGASGYMSHSCLQKIYSNQCDKKSCPYLSARNVWVSCPSIKTTNSSFYITAPNMILQTAEDERLDLTIIDECHEIDKVVIENTSIKFPKLDVGFKRLKDTWNTFIQYYSEVFDILMKLPKDKHFNFSLISSDDLETLKIIYEESIRVSVSLNQKAETLKNSDSVKYKIASQEALEFAKSVELLALDEFQSNYFKWIIADLEDDGGIKLVPLSTRSFRTHQVLFSKANQHIHMSATICGIKQYTENLDIKPDEYVFIDTHNPIPEKNRPIYLDKTLHINKDTNVLSIVNLIDSIIREQSGNGVIHTVSFKLANDIKNNSRFKSRMIVSNNREEILSTLSKSNDKIILSPSIETGYDFKGDLARWQIIAKIPFLNLGDLYTKERKNLNANWYTRETILRFVQSAGRVCRGVNDYGKTYVIDQNVFRLIQSNISVFPEWFLNSIVLD